MIGPPPLPGDETPRLTARQAAEDDVRQLIDPLERPLQALAYTYLFALGWRIDDARRIVREAFGA